MPSYFAVSPVSESPTTTEGRRLNTQLRFIDVPLDDNKTLERRARHLGDLLDLFHRPFDEMRLDQQEELRLGRGKLFQQAAGDKAGKTREEDRSAVEHSTV